MTDANTVGRIPPATGRRRWEPGQRGARWRAGRRPPRRGRCDRRMAAGRSRRPPPAPRRRWRRAGRRPAAHHVPPGPVRTRPPRSRPPPPHHAGRGDRATGARRRLRARPARRCATQAGLAVGVRHRHRPYGGAHPPARRAPRWPGHHRATGGERARPRAEVPDLVGDDCAEAADELVEAGLYPRYRSGRTGEVTAQEPAEDARPAGTTRSHLAAGPSRRPADPTHPLTPPSAVASGRGSSPRRPMSNRRLR